ncbi:hnRNP A1-gamma isoform [Mycena vulgaris]|nr:hnRNP A1-gamma isoform [Mycena vulgaris]
MSKATLDDLYGDIYGDDDIETAVPAEGPTPITPNPDPQPTVPTHHNLPPKPGSAPPSAASAHQLQQQQNAAANAASLSYSAQIAQQFSAYQQTPSQERQQRSEMPARTQSTSAIPTHATPTFNISSSEDTVFGKKPSEMHDAGKMFIGGLNWDTTDEGLRNYFSEFGKVDACTIMRDPSGTSRGFAFMTFEDPSCVATVLGREHVLDGKAIDPKRAIPREEHLRNTRYFVGGLSPATTSESMKEFFSACKQPNGKVVDATVMVDRESSRSKGFGFVTFEDATNADQLVGKLGLTIDDKEIEVKMAQPRSQRDQGRMANGNGRDTTIFNDRDSRTPPQTMSFVNPQQMSMMYQRQMGQVPMMGAGMGTGMGAGMGGAGMGAGMGTGMGGGMAAGAMGNGAMGGGMPMMGMGMNPMAMMGMGMGMNGFNPMAGMGGMGGMGGMNGMNMMGGGMGGMGNMGMNGMRMGMGGTGTGMGMGAGMGMAGMRPGMAGAMARMVMNTGGAGPARTNTRGQHNFHPYSR